MKTSNKILLGFLAVVFTVPLLFAFALKSKMKKGEYTVGTYKKAPKSGSMRSGTFTAFKVVKVVSPHPQMLSCHLKIADTMSYNYRSDSESNDSVVVVSTNDTLLIKYMEKIVSDGGEERDRTRVRINVNLAVFDNLIVDGAEVILDSSSDNLSVSLKNRGVIKDGNKSNGPDGTRTTPGVKLKEEKVISTTAKPGTEAKSIGKAGKKTPDARQTSFAGGADPDMKDLLVFRFI